MTGDLGERTSLSSYRFVFAMIAQLDHPGARAADGPLLRPGRQRQGLPDARWASSRRSRSLLFFITFATTKERIQPPPDQKASVEQHFTDLLKQRAVAGDVRPDAGAVHHAVDARQRRALLLQLLRGQGQPGGVPRHVRGDGGRRGPHREPRVQHLQRARHARHDHRHLLLEGARGAVRQAQRVHRGPDRHGVLHRGLLRPARRRRSPAMFAVRDPPPVRLRVHDPAAVGDDGRRRGLLGVEDRAPCHGDRLLGHRVRPEGGARASAERSPATCCRSTATCRTSPRGRDALDGHPLHDERVPGDHLRDLRRRAALLRDRQVDRDPDDGRAGGAPGSTRRKGGLSAIVRRLS